MECTPNCNMCSGDSITECSDCTAGFYLNNNNKCKQCSDNCIECSSADVC